MIERLLKMLNRMVFAHGPAGISEYDLHNCVEFGDHDWVQNFCEQAQDSAELSRVINSPDAQGETAMHIACRRGFTGIVQTLLDHGGNADIKDPQGRTCRDIAEANGWHEVAELLDRHRRT